MAIEYSGYVFTDEEILRFRENNTRSDNTEIAIKSMIASVGIDNFLWALMRIGDADAKKVKDIDDPTEDEITESDIGAMLSDGIFKLAVDIAQYRRVRCDEEE